MYFNCKQQVPEYNLVSASCRSSTVELTGEGGAVFCAALQTVMLFGGKSDTEISSSVGLFFYHCPVNQSQVEGGYL